MAEAAGAGAPKVENAPKLKPIEAARADARVVKRAAMEARLSKMEPGQRAKDHIGQLREVIKPGTSFSVTVEKDGQKVEEPGMPVTASSPEKALRVPMQTDTGEVSGVITKIFSRDAGDLVTVEIDINGVKSQEQIPMEVIEDAQLSAEAGAILGGLPDAQRAVVEAYIRDYRGETKDGISPVQDAQLADAFGKVQAELGLVDAASVKTELQTQMTAATDPAVKDAYNQALQGMEGRVVMDGRERQSIMDSITAPAPEAAPEKTKLTKEDVKAMVDKVQGKEINPKKPQDGDKAKQRALETLANGDLSAETVMKVLSDIGLSEKGLAERADSLQGDLRAANNAVVEAKKILDKIQGDETKGRATPEAVAAAKEAYTKAVERSHEVEAEKQLYEAASQMMAKKGREQTKQLIQNLIDGKTDPTRAKEILKAMNKGDVSELLAQIGDIELPKAHSAEDALKRAQIIEDWKKRGQKGGLYVLLALLMAVVQAPGLTGLKA